jgi:hypothetical protein
MMKEKTGDRERVKNADVVRVLTVAGNQFERARNTITREGRRIMKEKNTDRMRIGTLARSQISRVRNVTQKGRGVTCHKYTRNLTIGKTFQTSSWKNLQNRYIIQLKASHPDTVLHHLLHCCLHPHQHQQLLIRLAKQASNSTPR